MYAKKKKEKQGTQKEADLPYRQLISLCAHTFRLATPQNSTRSNWVPGNSATSVGSSSSWPTAFNQPHVRAGKHTHTHHNYRGPISDVKPSFSWWQDETTNGCRWLASVGLPSERRLCSWDRTHKNHVVVYETENFFLHCFWFSASFVLMLHNSAMFSAADQVQRWSVWNMDKYFISRFTTTYGTFSVHSINKYDLFFVYFN